MPRQVWSDGQELVQSDLSAISAQLERELYDRHFYEMRRRQGNVAFGDSFTVSYVNSTTSQVKLGNGIQTDNTQVDPEPLTRPLYVSANSNVTHTAAHATLNRIDIVSIRANRATSATASRNYKDPTTGAITSTSFNVETDWTSDLLVTAGTASGSPAVPSTPSGYIKLAEVLVTASSGIAGSGAYTDKRPRFRFSSSWNAIKTLTTTYTVDFDDETLILNDAGGNFTVTLPPVADCYDSTTKLGKILRLKKLNSSANTVTIQANASETIDGANTQAISAQYTELVLQSDGSNWYLL